MISRPFLRQPSRPNAPTVFYSVQSVIFLLALPVDRL